MKAGGILVALIAAVALQTTLGRFFSRGAAAIDLVLVVVVYVGLVGGPVAGLLAGTLGGLAQDALSSGIIGIGGLAKTVVGFLTGVGATQFIVAQPFPRFVVFFVATFLHAAVFLGLYALVDLRQAGTPPYAAIAGQALGNAIVGILAFQLGEALPGAVDRRRGQKSRPW